MGNTFTYLGCSTVGEHLLAAARDGDLAEVTRIVTANPRVARYIAFGVQNAPIHFAAARGHVEVLNLLLRYGADVDTRNYHGQTALMHACRCGHWQVVQVLMIHRADIAKFDLLTGRNPLHYAAAGGHVQCVRLLLADHITSTFQPGLKQEGEALSTKALAEVVNARADCGVSALHFAALNGFTETVQLLLDAGAHVNALTGRGIPIGAGSTPLHYAACSGNISCCQALLARGANRGHKNHNGWTAQHVARLWKRFNLNAVLEPAGEVELPEIAPSRYLALPLHSIVHIARETLTESVPDGSVREGSVRAGEACGVCFERSPAAQSSSCGHQLCVQCAIHLCIMGSHHTSSTTTPALKIGAIPCPFCRQGITTFEKLTPRASKPTDSDEHQHGGASQISTPVSSEGMGGNATSEAKSDSASASVAVANSKRDQAFDDHGPINKEVGMEGGQETNCERHGGFDEDDAETSTSGNGKSSQHSSSGAMGSSA